MKTVETSATVIAPFVHHIDIDKSLIWMIILVLHDDNGIDRWCSMPYYVMNTPGDNYS